MCPSSGKRRSKDEKMTLVCDRLMMLYNVLLRLTLNYPNENMTSFLNNILRQMGHNIFCLCKYIEMMQEEPTSSIAASNLKALPQ